MEDENNQQPENPVGKNVADEQAKALFKLRAAEKASGENGGVKPEDALDKLEAGNDANLYKPEGADLADVNESIRGRLGSMANRAFGAISRNKGKSAAIGAGGIGGIIAIFFAGSVFIQTQLMHITGNISDKSESLGNSTVEAQAAELQTGAKGAVLNRFLAKFRYQENMRLLSEKLRAAGYVYDPSNGGKLITPNGEITDPKRINTELKLATKGQVRRGIINRSKPVRDLRNALSIPVKSPTEPKLIVDDDGNQVPAKSEPGDAIEETRRQVIKGDGEPSSRQVKTAVSEMDEAFKSAGLDDAAEEATEEADELIENPLEDAGDNTARRAARATTKEARDAIGSSGLSIGRGAIAKADPVVDITERICRVGRVTVATVTAGLVIKKFNLIKHFSAVKRVAEGKAAGTDKAELTNEFMNQIQSNPVDGTTLTSGAGMAFVLGGQARSPSPASLSYFGAARTNPGGIISLLSRVVNFRVPVTNTNACSILLNPATQAGIAIGSIAAQVAACATGVGCGATAGWQTMARVIARGIAAGIAIGVAAEVATSVAEGWLVDKAKTAVGNTITTFSRDEAGAFSGDGMVSGGFVWGEAKGRAAGNQPLPRAAYVAAVKELRTEERIAKSKQSLFARFASLDPNNYNSLASTALARSPVLLSSPATIAESSVAFVKDFKALELAKNFASTAFTTPTYAQDGGNIITDERGLVTDPFGSYIVGNNFDGMKAETTLTSLESSGDIDASGEPIDGSDLQKYIEECTDIEIRVIDTVSNTLNSRCLSYDQNAFVTGGQKVAATQSIGGSNKTKLIQHYLSIQAAMSAIDANFNPGIEEEERAPLGPAAPTGGVITEAQTAVTKNGGGIRVLASLVPRVEAMIDAAARDGLTLTGGGWRDTNEQIRLREAHGCGGALLYDKNCKGTPPTARPGTSNHERGTAIDFNNCRTRSTRCYQWLSQNAANFGFYNFPKEPWHWSIDGK